MVINLFVWWCRRRRSITDIADIKHQLLLELQYLDFGELVLMCCRWSHVFAGGFEVFVVVLAFQILVGGNNHAAAVDRNLPANPPAKNIEPVENAIDMLPTGSGSFPATPAASSPDAAAIDVNPAPNWEDVTSTTTSSTSHHHQKPSLSAKVAANWQYILLSIVFLVVIVLAFLIIRLSRICAPWKNSATSRDKQTASGVKKLRRADLDASCEDFSNIIQSYPQFTVYKGTLSNGLEIAVISTAFPLLKDWSKLSQTQFMQKVALLSRINHKNFVNLLGYCVEKEPFTRMMVYEFACNGTLSENLHCTTAAGLEHLEWGVRMRVIMGIAYCLQYMHHELDPPVAHTNLHSSSILLSTDYAAKIVEIDFWKHLVVPQQRIPDAGDEFTHHNSDQLSSSIEGNIYSFGILLLEIISGKPAYTKEKGSIIIWMMECLRENQSTACLVDPALTGFKQDELDVIYKVSQECINPDPKIRPTMAEVTAELSQVLAISPDSATPKMSTLWWSELLSLEAT